MLSPAVVMVVGDAVFVTVIPGVGFAEMVAVEGGDTGAVPVGGVPVAVAVFANVVRSRSACVIVYVAVQGEHRREAQSRVRGGGR